MQKIIKDYNHNLTEKLLAKLKYMEDYQQEVESFDLLKYLFGEKEKTR